MPGRDGDNDCWRPQRPPGATKQLAQGGPGNRHIQPWIGGPYTAFNPVEMLHGGRDMEVEDVEIGEEHYRQGGLHTSL